LPLKKKTVDDDDVLSSEDESHHKAHKDTAEGHESRATRLHLKIAERADEETAINFEEHDDDITRDLTVADGVVNNSPYKEKPPGDVCLPSGIMMELDDIIDSDLDADDLSPVSLAASPRVKRELNSMRTMEMNRVRLLPDVRRQAGYKNRDLFSTIGFVTFKSRKTAYLASQTTYCENPSEWQVKMAPDPRSVYWHHIATKPVATNQLSKKIPYLLYIMLAIALPFLGLLNTSFMSWVEDPETNLPRLLKLACTTLVANSAMKYFLLLTPSIFKVAFVYAGRMDRAWNYDSIQNAQFVYQFLFVLLASPVSNWIITVVGFGGNGQNDADFFGPILNVGGVVMGLISNFTRIISFATFSFITLSCGFLQLRRMRYYLVNRFYYRHLPEDAWNECRIWNHTKWTVPLRMNEGAFMITIFYVYFIAVPLIAILFVLLMVFARAVSTYRMLYMDYGQDVDTGGVYWRNFQTQILVVSAFAQTIVVIIIADIAPHKLPPSTIILIFAPLYTAMLYVFRKIENQRWEHLVIQHPDLHKEKRNPKPAEYPFIQPQLWERNNLRSSHMSHDARGEVERGATIKSSDAPATPAASTSSESKNYFGMGQLLRRVEKDLRKKHAWRNRNIQDYRMTHARGYATGSSNI